MSEATINTQPVGTTENPTPGPGSFGHTDASGRFTLELQSEPTKGAVPGEHRVFITPRGFSDDPTSDEVSREDRITLPAEYFDGTLTITIPDEGDEAIVLELESGRRRRRR